MSNDSELRVPPNSTADEQSVLGGVLTAGLLHQTSLEAMADVIEIASIGDFYREDHRLIFSAMVTMFDRRLPIDVVTLSGFLKDQSSLENAGGFAYLVDMQRNTPSAANIKFYAKRVKTLATKRRFISAMSMALNAAYNDQSPAEDSVLSLLESTGAAVSRLEMEQSGGDTSVTLKQAERQALSLIELYSQKRGGVIGVDTGLESLNAAIGGWHDTDLIIIDARSGMGKTALALTLAKSAAKRSKVGFISTEMAASQLGMRRLAQGSGVSMTKIRRGDLDESDFALISNTVVGDVESGLAANIRINESALDLDTIKRQARAWKREFGMELMIVDYLQNIPVYRKGIQGDKVQEVATVSSELKDLAKRLRIPIILLAQVKRDVDQRSNKRPMVGDTEWSSKAQQDADVKIGLYRHAYYHPDMNKDVSGIAEIIIQKNRHGETGTHYSVFRPARMDFVDADEIGVMQYLRDISEQQPSKKSYAKDF